MTKNILSKSELFPIRVIEMAVKLVKFEVKDLTKLPSTIQADFGDGEKTYLVDKFLTSHLRTSKIVNELSRKKINVNHRLDEHSLLKLARYYGVDLGMLDTSSICVITPKFKKKLNLKKQIL